MPEIELPPPRFSGEKSFEEVLRRRRSRRCYTPIPLTLEEVSQLLWAAQGIVDPLEGRRTAPSAGATYPMEVYLLVKKGGVTGLAEGIYEYKIKDHSLKIVAEGDFSAQLYRACLGQEWVLQAPINIIVVAYPPRTTSRYGERGHRYIHMEAGCISQNIYLQAESLGLGTVVIGAFHDERIRELLGLSKDYMILLVHPVGKPCVGE